MKQSIAHIALVVADYDEAIKFYTEKLGFDIPADDMRAAFESLELAITREEETEQPKRGPAWTVSIPSWRDDLDRPIDLVEEVLRLYGTEKNSGGRRAVAGLARRGRPHRRVQSPGYGLPRGTRFP